MSPVIFFERAGDGDGDSICLDHNALELGSDKTVIASFVTPVSVSNPKLLWDGSQGESEGSHTYHLSDGEKMEIDNALRGFYGNYHPISAAQVDV